MNMDISPKLNPTSPTIRIGIALIDGFALMSYAATVEPFRSANMIAGQKLFEIINFSVSPDVATSSNNALVPSMGGLSEPGRLDMLFVVAGGHSEDILKAPIRADLRALDRQGVTLGGVSGGPLALAAAGLMEGRRMTVHWEHRETLEQLSPNLLIERSIYVMDRNRVTCAGGIAPLDMTHAIIAKMHGIEFARKVSDWFLHTQIRPSQSNQKSSIAERYQTKNRHVLEAIELMENHIAEPLSGAKMATMLNLSSRQLSRIFQDELGVSPIAFYLELRLESARRLLKNTSLPMTEVALATGFGSSSHFSTRFKSHFGMTPSAIERRTS